MPKATITLNVLVTLDVPVEYARQVTCDDLAGMARAAVPDSSIPECSCSEIQVQVEDVCQEESDGTPVMADVFIEHDITQEPDIRFDDDGFTTAED